LKITKEKTLWSISPETR